MRTSLWSLVTTSDRPYATPGLTRFTRAHAVSAAGDAFVTVSLAGSLFFSVSPEASRRQILIYLIVTMAPFVVLAPLIGPAIDRFRRGHRWIAVLIYLARAALSIALAYFLFTLVFYVLALALLVANKASGVLKSALVPGLVDDPTHLVAANSRLARVTTIVGGAGGAVAAGLASLTSSTVTLAGAAVLFTVSAATAARLPPPRRAHEGHDEVAEEHEFEQLHRPLVTASATAYTVIRFAVGAFIFGLAFALRRTSEPAWMYGAAVVAYGVGAYLGNVGAPMARRRLGEDRLIAAALVGLGFSAAFGALGASRLLVVFVSLVMGAVTTFGRQGFDALVQRHAPSASHGRSFARFETQFQFSWVIGATFATAASVPTRIGLAVVATIVIPAAWIYLRSAREARRFGVGAHAAGVESAVRSHLAAADAWLEEGRPRLAAVEASAAIELAAASGIELSAELRSLTRRVRADALDHDHGLEPARVAELLQRFRSTVIP